MVNLRSLPRHPTARRWFAVYAYAILGAALAPQMSALYHWLFGWITASHNLIYASWSLHLACGVAFLLVFWATTYFQPRLNHFKPEHLLRFPPVLLAVPFAGVVLSAHELVWIRQSAVNALVALWPFWAYVVAVLAWCKWFQKDAGGSSSKNAVSAVRELKDLLELPDERVLAWLQDQAPIQSASEDLFGMGQRATRIMRWLRQPRSGLDGDGKRQTIAIVGPYGVGKSSLVNLSFRGADPNVRPRFLFVSTNCWGFESSSRAREHILEACVERLAEEVDCAFLRPLPGHFVEAVQEAEGWWKSLTVLLPGDNSPAAQLRKLTPVLAALDAHLVIAIEDVDRNGPNFDQEQFESILHQLRQVERLSFVLTAGPKGRIEFHKAAEQVELLEALPASYVLALVDKVRNRLRKDDYIDPELLTDRKEKNRPNSLLGVAYGVVGSSFAFKERIDTWHLGIGAILDTPRVLKGALATFVEKWEQLRGEVDIDELLMFVALREGAPEAATYVVSNLHAIRLLGAADDQVRGAGKSPKQMLVDDLETRWEKTVVDRAQFDVRAAATVLCELFPAAGAVVGHNSLLHTRQSPVQGVRHRSGPSYLNRIISGEIEMETLRDQVGLKLLKRVAESEDGAEELARAVLRDGRIGERTVFLENEIGLLSGNQSRRLAVVSGILKKIREQDGRRAVLDEDSFHGLWPWVPQNGGQIDELKEWYLAEIRASLPGNLFLAASLFQQATHHPSIQRGIVDATSSLFEEKLKAMSPQDFVAGLNPDVPHTLSRLVNPDYGSRRGGPNPFGWMRPLVLAALRQRPDIVIEEVFWGFGSFRRTDSGEWSYDFTPRLLEVFFGESMRQVYSIIAEYVPPINLEPASRRNFEAVALATKQELAKLGTA